MGYNLLINRVYWGYNPRIQTIDPNFLGHPSTVICPRQTKTFFLVAPFDTHILGP